MLSRVQPQGEDAAAASIGLGWMDIGTEFYVGMGRSAEVVRTLRRKGETDEREVEREVARGPSCSYDTRLGIGRYVDELLVEVR